MIGSHDTYTFQKARNWFVNLISGYWRCQKKNINGQYNSGVRFFDIRVFRDKGVWRTAHGLAEFDQTFESIERICKHFDSRDILFRIWMEKGSDSDWELFKEECTLCKDEYPGFKQAIRKKGEVVLFSELPKMEYYACKMEEPKNFLNGFTPIKTYAKKNNPQITQEMIEDRSVIYFMDYV